MRGRILWILFITVWMVSAIFGFVFFERVYSYRSLNNHEKNLVFFSENAFYYSFYNDLTSNKKIEDLVSTDELEYPDKINVLTKFKVAPELILASIYPVSKGLNVSPMDFYLYGVFVFMGLTFALTFLISFYLTGSILYSFIPLYFLVISLPYSTRAIVFPSLRENFAVPFLLLSIYIFQKILDGNKKYSFFGFVFFAMSLFIQVIFWQFSVYSLLFLFLGVVVVYVITRKPTVIPLLIITGFILVLGYMLNNLGSGGGQHVFNYILFRLSIVKPDFHTMNYWCGGIFRSLSGQILSPLTKNLLVPFSILGIVYAVKNKKYPIIILGTAYLLVAIISERFLVLSLPIWAAIAGGAFALKLDKKDDKLATIVMLALLAFSFLTFSLDNTKAFLWAKYGVSGDQYNLMTWIRNETAKDSVFAGPSDLTAQIRLSTKRKITINPFYEDSRSREKSYRYFQLYNKISEKDYYKALTKEKADYLIVDNSWCYGTIGICTIEDMFKNERKDDSAQLLCRSISRESKFFKKAYSTEQYVVYEVL